MRFILWAFALFLPLSGFSQDTLANRFEIVAWWGPEDAFLYRIEKIKEVFKNGERTEYDSSTSEVLFEVLDSTESGYLLGWTYQSNLFEGQGVMPKLPDSILAKLNDADKSTPSSFIYKTDEVGSFTGIENSAEIRLSLLSKLAIIEDMYADQKEREVFQKVLAPIKGILTSEQGIEQLIGRELQLFHMLFGIALDSGSSIEYDDQLPNLFGGAPIPAKSRLTQTSMDTLAGTFVVINETTPQEKAVKKLMQEFMVKVAPDKKEAKKAVSKMDIQMLNRHAYEMYYGYYLPKSINSVQRIEINLDGESNLRFNRLRIYMPDEAGVSEETPE